MPIPKYHEIMLPLLKIISDGEVYFIWDVTHKISDEFNLTDEEREEKLASGIQTVIRNRTGWARTYLKKAGLVEDLEKQGYFKITQAGIDLLAENPPKINSKLLMKYESFKEFRTRKKSDDTTEVDISSDAEDMTPQDMLDSGYKKLSETIADELLTKIKENTPDFFEKLVVELLVKMGYGGSLKEAGEIVGKSGDGGIDGIIKEDKLGLDKIYIQAKRWQDSNTVGRPEIQKFVGALSGQGAAKGIFITTSKFSQEAVNYVKYNNQFNVVLIDGIRLADLMIEYNLGVSTTVTYEIKKIDSDYFVEE